MSEKENACPVMMSYEPCGRPIYSTHVGVDKTPVYLMHSRDPNKDTSELEKEIIAILNGTSEYHGGKLFDLRGRNG